MLGRGRLTFELCRRSVLGADVDEMLVRLGERTAPAAEDDDGWCNVKKLPDCRESD